MEPTSLVIISIAVPILINALILAAAWGGQKGTLKAHTTLLANQSRELSNLWKTVNGLMLNLAVVAATCESYFAHNPNPQASQKMGEVVEHLQQMQMEISPRQEDLDNE